MYIFHHRFDVPAQFNTYPVNIFRCDFLYLVFDYQYVAAYSLFVSQSR